MGLFPKSACIVRDLANSMVSDSHAGKGADVRGQFLFVATSTDITMGRGTTEHLPGYPQPAPHPAVIA